MYIFDTDHFSVLERGGDSAEKLIRKLGNIKASELAVTIITYQEQIQGRLAYLNQSKNISQQVKAYSHLRKQLANYCKIPILDFDESATIEFHILKKKYRRIGTMDLKITAIALSINAILLTRNNKDFGQIENLKITDWTQ